MFGQIIKSKSDGTTYLSLSRYFQVRYSTWMRKSKVSVNWEEVKPYFLHPTEERNLLPPRQRQFSFAIASVTAEDLLPQ